MATLVLLGGLRSGSSAAFAQGNGPWLRARAYQDHIYVRAYPRNVDDVRRIWQLDAEIVAPHDPELATHELVMTQAQFGKLTGAGIPARIEAFDVDALITRSLESSGVREGELPAAVMADKLDSFGPFFTKIQDLAAITNYLKELEQLAGGRARLMPIGKTVQNRDILAMRFTGAGGGGDRPAVLVLGTQHPREWASPMVAMAIVDGLVRRYDADPKVRRIVDNLDIYVVPVANPDGYVATFSGRRLQRKNMNPMCGVDLNRNYDAAFGAGTPMTCAAETYPGRSAFSEPESQAVRDLVQSFKKPRLFIDYHSTAAQIMIPYAYTPNMPPNHAANKALCELYSSALRAVNGTNYPARPGYNLARRAGGGAFDWFRMKFGDAIVVELGGRAFDLPADDIVPYAEENFVASLTVLAKVVGEDIGDDAGTRNDGSAMSPVAPEVSGPAPAASDASVPMLPPVAPGNSPDAASPTQPALPVAMPLAPVPNRPGPTEGPTFGCAFAAQGPEDRAGLASVLLALFAVTRRRRARRRSAAARAT